MSYFTGTVNGTNELLDVIKANAIAQNYTLNRDRVDGSPSTRELILTAVNGAVIGFKLINISNDSTGYPENNNIELNLSTSYDDLATFQAQPNSYSVFENDNIGAFCRENMTIEYHLSITAGRIFCAYSIDGYWHTFYAGNFWPYDTPLNFANPLFLSGNNDSDNTNDYLSVVSSSFNIVGGSDFATGAMDNAGNWIFSSQTNNWTSTTLKLCIEPFGTYSSASQWFGYNKDGSYTFIPVVLINNETGYTFGELDGIYRVSPYGLKGGDIISDGTNNYLVFKRQIFESNSDGMFAFKLI